MAINKKLIHFQTMANFEAQLSAGNILDTSIVFIKDAKKIWTHGQFYDCADGVDSVDWADIQNKPTIPTKTSELENDSGFLAESLTGYYISSLQLTGDLRNDIGDILKWSSTSKQLRVSDAGGDTIIRIVASGDGTKFLANDGKYKTALTEHQDISGKQDKLVSGSSIKTINGTSLLGSGNITVATQAYVDSKIGDINTILESIIGGGSYYYGLAQYSEEELLNIVDDALEE